MLNIIEAASLADKGKRIRRAIWPDNRYIVPDGRRHSLIQVWNGGPFEPTIEDILADDWEIVE